VLASLLTGLREVRTRLIVGFAWLFAGYLVIGHIFPKPPGATGVAADIYAVARFVTPVGIAVALGTLAYLIGIVAAHPIRIRGWDTLVARLALPSRVDDALTDVVVDRLAERLVDDSALRAQVVGRTVAIGQSRGIVVGAALLDDLLRKESGLRREAVRALVDTAEPVAALRVKLSSVAGQAGPEYERLCAERDFRYGMAAPLAVLVLTLAFRGSPWWLLALLVPALLVRAAVTAGRDAQLLLVPRLEARPQARLRDGLEADTSWAWQAVPTVGALAVSPNATVVAGGTGDGRIHLWDAESGEVIRTLPGHAQEVTCVAFSPDGDLLVSGGEDHRTRVWDLITGEERHRIDHDEAVTGVAINRDGVLVIGTRSTLTWWYPDAARPTRTDLGSRLLEQMALDPESKLLAVALDDGTLRVYVGEIPVDLATYEDLTLAGWSGLNPFVVGFTRAADEVELRSWDPLTGRPIHPAATVAGQLVRPTLARPHGSSVAVADAADQILLLDAQTGELTHTLTGHREAVTALAWSANGDVLASSANDGTVIVWDMADGRQRLRLVPPAAGPDAGSA
jgi:WD40 repeat protein